MILLDALKREILGVLRDELRKIRPSVPVKESGGDEKNLVIWGSRNSEFQLSICSCLDELLRLAYKAVTGDDRGFVETLNLSLNMILPDGEINDKVTLEFMGGEWLEAVERSQNPPAEM